MSKITDKLISGSICRRDRTAAELWNNRPQHETILRSFGRISFHRTVGVVLCDLSVGNYPKDPRFVGKGFEQLVFTSEDGKEVEKLLAKTIGSSKEKAETTAGRLQELSDITAEHMGDFWLPTSFYASKLSTRLGRHAVVAVQPFIRPITIFDNMSQLYTYRTDRDYQTQQQTLCARIANLYANTGLLPDMLTEGNFATINDADNREAIRVIDTLPETPDKHRNLARNRGRTRLEAHLEILDQWGRFTGPIEEDFQPAAEPISA